jgi:hypothetical protein
VFCAFSPSASELSAALVRNSLREKAMTASDEYLSETRKNIMIAARKGLTSAARAQ